MAYGLSYSDYTPPAAPPAPPAAPPTPASVPGGPSFIGLPQPPDVPCDPTGDGWRGPQGFPGEPGPPGPPGTTTVVGGVGEAPADGAVYGRQGSTTQWLAALPLTGGTVKGNLTINNPVSYAGQTPTNSKTGLNIQHTGAGSTDGSGWTGLNAINITADTLDVNPPANVLCSFQGSINGKILTVSQPITGTPSVTLTGSISGKVLTVTSLTGAVAAGLTLNWTSPTPGTATIMSGAGMPACNLDANYGTIPSQAMSMVGPKPAQTLTWGPNSDPATQQTATIQTFNGTPNSWLLTQDHGVVPLQPMQMITSAGSRQAIGLWFNHYFGGTGATGGRSMIRAQLVQSGPMPRAGGGFYQGMLIGTSLQYSSGGTDVWSGASGQSVAINPITIFRSPGTTGASGTGATNYRGLAASEVDYGCAAGSPDDPLYPLASVASVGAMTFVRDPRHTWAPPIWENDFVLGFGQAGSIIRDASGNLVPVRQARVVLRVGSPSINPIDPATGKFIGVFFCAQAYNTDGSLGAYPLQGRHAIDWYNFDWTGTLYRGRGMSITGSGSALPYAVQVGGGYLSATNTTVSLDTAGSVCTGATVSGGGANLIPGTACVHDDTGTVVIVTAVSGIGGPGAATAVSLIPQTGRAHNSQMPPNPVQFRATGNPLSFPAPGPTGPQLNLTWTAPTTLALQPSGGTTTVGGILNTGSIVSAGTAQANIVLVGTTAAAGTELLNVNGGFVMGGTVGAGQGGTINVKSTGGTLAAPMIINDGVTSYLSGPGGKQLWIASAGSAHIVMDSLNANSIIEARRQDGTQGTPVATSSGAIIGQYSFAGYDGTQVAVQAAIWQVSASGTWSLTNRGTYQSWFITKQNTTAFVEQMRLSQYGNLLLGTTLLAEDTINAIQCNGNIRTYTFLAEGITNNITLTGSNQATALALTTGLNVLTSVPAGSGGVLPRGGVTGGCSPGTFVDIFNTTTAAAKVYGTTIATIDGAAATTGVTLSGNARCRYWMTANGTWISTLLGAPSA